MGGFLTNIKELIELFFKYIKFDNECITLLFFLLSN